MVRLRMGLLDEGSLAFSYPSTQSRLHRVLTMAFTSFGENNHGLQVGTSHGPIYFTSGELLIARNMGPDLNQRLIAASPSRTIGTPPRASINSAFPAGSRLCQA